MTSYRALIQSVFVACLSVGRLCSAATRPEIQHAIDSAKACVYSAQQPDGTWEAPTVATSKDAKDYARANWGGLTAMSVYALLAAGESAQEPRLAKAIEFLKKADLVGTYSCSMRCMALLYLAPTPELRDVSQRDARTLLSLVRSSGNAAGHTSYSAALVARDEYSHSRSQYAALGLWAAAQRGIEVPDRYWNLVQEGWLRNQDASGGWSYKNRSDTPYPVTAGMTAAGVATGYLVEEFLGAGRRAECQGNPANPSMDAALAWLAKNMDKVATSQRYDRDFPLATLYTMERIGAGGGLKYIGTVNWFDKGAEWLVRTQRPGGAWIAENNSFGLADTNYGLLFLARGRSPIAVNKLDGSVTQERADWNQRPRDAANACRWIGQALERELAWQVVPLRAPLKDFLDAPILLIEGSRALTFKPEDVDRLKQYVEEGGLILGNADCASPAFAESFRKLGSQIFPAAEFRELPASHPVYSTMFLRTKWRSKPSVQGLSNGARELMILIPQADFGRVWERATVGGHDEANEFAANLLTYVTGNATMRNRGESGYVDTDPKVATGREIKLARLEYAGNWDPEPGGWRRLQRTLHNQAHVALSVVPTKLDLLSSDQCDVAYLTGSFSVRFTEAEREAVRRYVAAGKVLVIDAAGGSTEFATAIEQELHMLFPEATLATLDPLDPMYAHPALPEPLYRSETTHQLGTSSKSGRLQAIKIKGHVAILYSSLDLSCGLSNARDIGINGYTPDVATQLVQRIVLTATR